MDSGVVAGVLAYVGYEKGRSPVRFVSAKNTNQKTGGTPVPTISAGALRRMPGLPANVVAGVPCIERDRDGREIVIVPVRPYVREIGRAHV